MSKEANLENKNKKEEPATPNPEKIPENPSPPPKKKEEQPPPAFAKGAPNDGRGALQRSGGAEAAEVGLGPAPRGGAACAARGAGGPGGEDRCSAVDRSRSAEVEVDAETLHLS